MNQDFLQYLHTNSHGTVIELKELFGEVGVESMKTLGYITISPSSVGDTWHRTEYAKELSDLRYRKSNFLERIFDWIYINIRRINFKN